MKTTKLYDTRDAAEKFGVKLHTVNGWVKRGKLRATKMGYRYIIAGDDLESFAATYRHGFYALGLDEDQIHDDKETINKCLHCKVPCGCRPKSPLCALNKRKAEE